MHKDVTSYHSDMLNYRYFVTLLTHITITTKAWIELQNQSELMLGTECKADECERQYWESLVEGIVPPNVRIIRPSPMTKIR
jgi:hypothetical protein